MFNKNVEIGFQSAVCHLCQRALMPLLQNDRPECNGLYLGLGKTGKALLNLSFLQSYVQFYSMLKGGEDH